MIENPRTYAKKVLFFASSAPRFAGDSTSTFILNMAEDLCSRGWQVDLLVPHAQGLKIFEKIGQVNIYRFRYAYPESWQTLCYSGGALGNLRRSRLNFLLTPFFIISQAIALTLHLISRKYDIVHSHWLIPQGFIASLICKIFHIPHVVMIHGADIYSFRHKVFVCCKKACMNFSDRIIANSTSTQAIAKSITDKKTIDIIPTGASPLSDAEFLSFPVKERPCAPNQQLIVFLGRLVEEKGLSYLLDAMPLIRQKHNACLLIIGDGADRPKLEQRAKDIGIFNHCNFIGSVPHHQIYGYLKAGDVFVGPSVTTKDGWMEAQGNVFVEAMFARIPVVASNIGGIPDAVIHEKTGLLVAEKSPEEIADAVCRIFDNPALAHTMIDNGYRHALANFSRERSADKISSLYADILMQKHERK